MNQDKGIKSLVLNSVEYFIEIFTSILLFMITVISLIICFSVKNMGIGLGILFLIVGIILVFSTTWFYFCIIDMRNSLREIAINTSNYGKNTALETNKNIITESTNISNEQESKLCPNCGETIKKAAKKCRYCGTWFDTSLNGSN